MQRLRFLVWKEFLELRLNPRLFGVVVVAPIIQLTMLGYAATTDVRDVPVVVADGDRTARSRELIARFDGSPNFNVSSHRDHRGGDRTVSRTRRRAWLALSIPTGYGDDDRSEMAQPRCSWSPTERIRIPRRWRWVMRRVSSADTRRS